MAAPSFAERLHELLLLALPVLAALKRLDYGSDDDAFVTLRGQPGIHPWHVAWIALGSKYGRLSNFFGRSSFGGIAQPANEPLYDSLIDLANYALITAALYAEFAPESVEALLGTLRTLAEKSSRFQERFSPVMRVVAQTFIERLQSLQHDTTGIP